MKKYRPIRFLADRKTASVPDKWIVKSGTRYQCFWPMYGLNKCIRNCVPPPLEVDVQEKGKWKLLDCELLSIKEFSSYEEADRVISILLGELNSAPVFESTRIPENEQRIEKTSVMAENLIQRFEKSFEIEHPLEAANDVTISSLITAKELVAADAVSIDGAFGNPDSLSLSGEEGSIESNSIWGILRGLESFSQLLVLTEDKSSFRVNSTEINDEPRFSHRGLLLDTSRHYINVFTIMQILDGMTYNKLNVFHWHIVDEQSFPYQSKVFPELSNSGAYDSSLVYTQKDVAKVIEHARIRGIRVMVEFDTPGHTRSWGESHPEILTSCGDMNAGRLGPINPTVNASYEFMQKLLKKIVEVFPEKYVHIGGDEVGFECWESNQEVTEYMSKNNVSTFQMLEEIYIQRIFDFVHNLNASSVVWQEVFENGVHLQNGTVVQVWTGNRQLLLQQITKQGLPALLSSCWHLDHLKSGGDWESFYRCDPADFNATDEQKKLVLGGEACMWSEVVDNGNVLQRIFPRLSATAEKLWSRYDVTDLDDAAARLEEHTCRMKLRGLPVQPPNGPGFCLSF